MLISSALGASDAVHVKQIEALLLVTDGLYKNLLDAPCDQPTVLRLHKAVGQAVAHWNALEGAEDKARYADPVQAAVTQAAEVAAAAKKACAKRRRRGAVPLLLSLGITGVGLFSAFR